MDYQDYIREEIMEKSSLLKICTTTVLIRPTNSIIIFWESCPEKSTGAVQEETGCPLLCSLK